MLHEIRHRRLLLGAAALTLPLIVAGGWQRTRWIGVSTTADVSRARGTEASFLCEPLPASEAAKLGELDRGVTEARAYEVLGRPFGREFAVRRGGKEYVAVSYAFEERWLRYYLLFKDDRLMKVVEPPIFPSHDVLVPELGRVSVRDSLDPFVRVDRVLSAPDLSAAELEASVERRLPEPSTESNLGPVPYIMLPLIAAAAPREREAIERNRKLEAHFDPARVSLCMSETDVEAIYGPHVGERTESGLRCRAYGQWDEASPREHWHHAAPAGRFSWVVVAFDGGRAVAVFGNHFVDERRFIGFATARPATDGGTGS